MFGCFYFAISGNLYLLLTKSYMGTIIFQCGPIISEIYLMLLLCSIQVSIFWSMLCFKNTEKLYVCINLKENTKYMFFKIIYKPFWYTTAHWDFLPKFFSLHYYTTLEGLLGVQRSKQAQGTIICLFGPLFFSQNGMTFKKATKIIKIHWKVTVFWDIFRVCSILAGKQRPKPIRWT